jgi:hypothetical protein
VWWETGWRGKGLVKKVNNLMMAINNMVPLIMAASANHTQTSFHTDKKMLAAMQCTVRA